MYIDANATAKGKAKVTIWHKQMQKHTFSGALLRVWELLELWVMSYDVCRHLLFHLKKNHTVCVREKWRRNDEKPLKIALRNFRVTDRHRDKPSNRDARSHLKTHPPSPWKNCHSSSRQITLSREWSPCRFNEAVGPDDICVIRKDTRQPRSKIVVGCWGNEFLKDNYIRSLLGNSVETGEAA